ncbi:MAG TPA: BON domain-containing protein [Longimicrobiales bacterium]
MAHHYGHHGEHYGSEFRGGPRGRGWAEEERGYGWETRRPFGARARGRRPGLGYAGYDYEFGGRGWPYEEGYGPRGRRPYDWELQRPEGFGMGYGFEYRRSGPPGYRRARGRPGAGRVGAPELYYGAEYRGRYMRRGRGPYGEEFAGSQAGEEVEPRGEERRSGRFQGREFGRAAHPRYGHTPPDRWPDEGHEEHIFSSEARIEDEEIREAVRENLFQDSWINPENIEVEVDNGVVTLSGEVNDFMEARYAWDDAWEAPGVRGVINNLTVRTDVPASEMHLPQTSGPKFKGRERGTRR